MQQPMPAMSSRCTEFCSKTENNSWGHKMENHVLEWNSHSNMDQVWIPFKKHPLPVQNMYSPPLKFWNYYHLPVTPDIYAIKPSSTFSSSSDLSALMIQSFKHAAIGTLNLEGLIHLTIQLLICQTDIAPSSSSKELVWPSHWLQLTCTSVTRTHWSTQ